MERNTNQGSHGNGGNDKNKSKSTHQKWRERESEKRKDWSISEWKEHTLAWLTRGYEHRGYLHKEELLDRNIAKRIEKIKKEEFTFFGEESIFSFTHETNFQGPTHPQAGNLYTEKLMGELGFYENKVRPAVYFAG